MYSAGPCNLSLQEGFNKALSSFFSALRDSGRTQLDSARALDVEIGSEERRTTPSSQRNSSIPI